MAWVVARNMPLCEVDNDGTRAMTKLKCISSKILKKYMTATTRAVERKIVKEIAENIGLMLDGWSCYSDRFVDLFTVYCHDGVLKQPLWRSLR